MITTTVCYLRLVSCGIRPNFFLKQVLDALLYLMWVILDLLVQFNMAQVNFQKRTK